MAFRLGRGGKRGSEAPLFNEDQVIWGVPRRAGLDEQDDPKAHAGLTQHAFEVGNDDRAICGFEPPKRASSPTAKPKAQLSMPNTRLNPRCPKCLKLIAVPVTEPAAAEADTPAEEAVAAAAEADVAAEAIEDTPLEDEPAPIHQAPAAARIGEAEFEGGYAVEDVPQLDDEQPADPPDPSVMAIVAAGDQEDPALPEPLMAPAPAEPAMTQAPVEPAMTQAPTEPAMQPWPPAPEVPVVPPPPPPARAAVDPPMSMRSASWEGTVIYAAGQMTALVRPPSQPGMGVVASVISGPSGTRVGSVHINSDGLAVISLSEPARGPVSVAWFAVPAVDENLRPGRP